jgi:DNA transposition AAA+ family ATPase
MPTRRQDPDSREFRQNAFASSAEYERGILGNLVAARCHKLTDRGEIALRWWLQQISWREGGLEAFAREFLAANSERIGTPSMAKYGTRPGQIYRADQVRQVRKELGTVRGAEFPLKDDPPFQYESIDDYLDRRHAPRDKEMPEHPRSYPASAFVEVCSMSDQQFADKLKQALVDPSDLSVQCGVWNFPTLRERLEAWRQREIEAARDRIVETAVTRQIAEELDFALETRSFILIEGREGIGKTEGARWWCDQHPGQVIYVRLEAGSDETTLYRSIARRVGTACSYQRKAVEMRARIQDALQGGHMMLVLDEAHYLWPQGDRSQRCAPKRMDWVRTALVDFGVPVALISTPQHFARQCDRFRKAGWNANQVQRRLARTVPLPEAIDSTDAVAVARSYFPGIPDRLLKRLAGVALLSVARLTMFSHMRKRVDFLASRRAGLTESELLEAALAEISAPGGVAAPAPTKPVADPLQGPRGRIAEPVSEGEHAPRNRLIKVTPELAPSIV